MVEMGILTPDLQAQLDAFWDWPTHHGSPSILPSLLRLAVGAASAKKWASLPVPGATLFASLLWFCWGFYARFHRYSIIVPRYKTEVPGFLKRNSDKIALAIISAFVGSLVTFLIKSPIGKGP
jgi:hypothetical protein